MKIPFLSRLLEIKEKQLVLEERKIRLLLMIENNTRLIKDYLMINEM